MVLTPPLTSGSVVHFMETDLSVIIVNWNVRELLRRCLSSLHETARRSGDSPRIIVVDNASTDGSEEMVRAEFPHVHLIQAGWNLGFTAGNNLGLKALFGDEPAATLETDSSPNRRASPPAYVCFLNPDTEVRGDALAQMRDYMQAQPDVAAVGPRLLYADGSVQSSRRRFPTLTTAFIESTLLGEWWPQHPAIRRYTMADQPDDEEQEVDWLVGACMMVRREAILQVGGFDEGFFMYSEELDWCRRARSAGWRVVYLPQATVVHHEGRSSEQMPATRHIHFQTSKVRYFRKHHGALAGEGLRFFLLSAAVYQWAREAVKWLLGHKRPLRRARMKAYGAVLRSRLRPYRAEDRG